MQRDADAKARHVRWALERAAEIASQPLPPDPHGVHSAGRMGAYLELLRTIALELAPDLAPSLDSTRRSA